jgi:uncharacterized protein YndB with AHSA1/START domain
MADILHSIQISAPAEAIYPLISTASGLAQWWAADVTETGAALELGFFNRQTVYRLRPQVNQQPSHFEWACETGKEWSGTRLIFKLEPAGSGTLFRFTHAGWQSATDYFVSCTTTWGELMFRLKSAAEGKSRGPLFLPASLAY